MGSAKDQVFLVTGTEPEPKPEPKSEPKPEPKSEPKPEPGTRDEGPGSGTVKSPACQRVFPAQ